MRDDDSHEVTAVLGPTDLQAVTEWATLCSCGLGFFGHRKYYAMGLWAEHRMDELDG